MKKTVSILTALLLAVSPVAQRAYAQEANVQAQQNVEESKASKVWGTVKECAGKTVKAVAENKGVIIGSTVVLAVLGGGILATVNGVTLKEIIKTIWAADGITMAQKVQLIAKVLFLRKEISAAELASLKNQNIISASKATIKNNESVIKSADEKLSGIVTEQKDLDTRKATQETLKYNAMCSNKSACAVYSETHKAMNITSLTDNTCTLGAEYDGLDCTAYDRERCKCGTNDQVNDDDCNKICPALDKGICKCNTDNQLTLDGCKAICKDQ